MKPTETQNMQNGSQNTLKLIRSILSGACVFFTIFAMAILATQLFGNNDLIQPLRFFLLFPFALCISVANLIFKAKKLNIFLKLVIHYAAIAASFYVCLCSAMPNINPIVLVLLLGVLYIIIATPILIVLKLKKKKSEPKPEYVSMFKGASRSSK